MIEVVLADAELAFEPLSPVNFNIDRLETNPRFAAISRPANAAILVRLRIDMEDRGGNIELLLPYATIEPIRDLLLQMFMGEKFGRDPIWEGHLATEIGQAEIAVDAVLYEARLPLRQHHEPRGRRHADARAQARCAGHGALRRRHADRRPHGHGSATVSRCALPSRCANRERRSPCSRRRTNRQIAWRRRELPFGLMIESMVAVLLLLTIVYCVLLNRRLRLLKADEQSLRVTISELITATEIAERAIAGLKIDGARGREDAEQAFGACAELSGEIEHQIKAGEDLLDTADPHRSRGPRHPGATRTRRQSRSGGRAGLRRTHAHPH